MSAHNLPPLPKSFAVLRLARDGTACDVAECEQDAEMWAHGIEEVYTAADLREYVIADRRSRADAVEGLVEALRAAEPHLAKMSFSSRNRGFRESPSVKLHEKVLKALSHVAIAIEQADTSAEEK